MTTPIRIDDPADPRLDDYRTLRDPELRKRYENKVGVFIAEGPNVVAELLRSDYGTRSVLVSDKRYQRLDLDGLAAPVYLADQDLIEEVVAFPLHQGAVAVGNRRPLPSPDEVLDGARTVVALEEMNDPENMGVLFRSVRALGGDAVLLGPRCSDPLYRRCVRVSMGHVLHVPFTETEDLLGTLADLVTVALVTDGDVELEELAAARPERLALVVGAEGAGLSQQIQRGVDVRVRIAMSSRVDSLNVSVATAIALHRLR
ncbi:MAG: RNA methyltransferase [Actinobacteria bacterium]|nr:RNA methyltransferase [Actinomycetota bacterium]